MSIQTPKLPDWLDNIRFEQAQDKNGKGMKILTPERGMKAHKREMPDPDMPLMFWADKVWDMMAYMECDLRTAKIHVYKMETGDWPAESLRPWDWENESFYRTDD